MADKVEGLEKLLAQVKNITSRYKRKGQVLVSVGYGALYAIYVHENLENKHPNGGQAKYLENPRRAMESQLRALILKRIKDGETTEDAMEEAGEKLLEASKRLVPVDTGELRDSGYVRIDRRESDATT